MSESKTDKAKCTLSDTELIEKSNDWVSKLAKTGGEAWTLRIPVDFNHDPDMLFIELGKRLKNASTENAQLREVLREIIDRCEILERSIMVHPDYVFGDDNDEWHTFIDCAKEPIEQAKQLLNIQEDEKDI